MQSAADFASFQDDKIMIYCCQTKDWIMTEKGAPRVFQGQTRHIVGEAAIFWEFFLMHVPNIFR